MKPPFVDINEPKDGIMYAPVLEVLEKFKQGFELPYKTTFSFLPLVNQLHGRADSINCKTTGSMISGIKLLEAKIAESNGVINDELQEEIDGISNMLLPSMFYKDQYSFVCPPFHKEIMFSTPKMNELMDGDKWLLKVDVNEMNSNRFGVIQKASSTILNKFYNQKIDVSQGDHMTFKNVKTGLEKHFKLNVRHDFVDVVTDESSLPDFNKREINEIINHLSCSDTLLKYLPANSFSFNGFGIITLEDITETQVISEVKDSAINTEENSPNEFRTFLTKQLKDFLGREDLLVGFADTHFNDDYNKSGFSLTGFRDFKKRYTAMSFPGVNDIYCTVFHQKKPLIVKDVQSIKKPSEVEKMLVDVGIESMLLIPLTNPQGKLTSIVEIASKENYSFNKMDVQKLEPIIELLNIGNEKFLKTMNNRIDNFIKNQFTSIHPSVEWKFIDVAERYEVKKGFGEAENEIEEIVFKDVYPLYGQADIVNSSTIRNEAIQKDLLDNLAHTQTILKSFSSLINFNLLDSYLLKVEETQEILNEGYTSSLESYVLDLLNREIHPLLRELVDQFDVLDSEELDHYFSFLDADIGIVYKQRQAYEQSVTKVNSTIANYLDIENKKLQGVLPHYFEKYKTDGVEYNMYVGQSILQDTKFSNFHLKDFKLWQLINICEVTKLVTNLEDKLPIPLKTAQLIFVYSSALSIRFRMDEKQFDVDGTYNVRYEILKKRIDKAHIRDSEERLSQPGKVSIVYLLEKDKVEYLDYLQFLIKKGYIKPDIEQLELEKLQGADGLKALRVEVI